MDPISLSALKGVLDVGDRLLNIYKIKTDGSFYKQKEFESRLREREAAVTAEIQASSAASNDWRGLEIQIATLSQTDRVTRILAANPFCLSVEDAKGIAQQRSVDGSFPLLLEAPIGIDKRASGPDEIEILDLDICQRWSRYPCASDAIPLEGLIERPLRRQDLDVHIIASSLSDVPVILTYGQVKADGSLWISLYAWNIVAKEPRPEPLKVAFPSVQCPQIKDDPACELRIWKDEISSNVITVVALLTQWFHLVRHGRRPTLDKLSSLEDGVHIRRQLAKQLVAAYEIVVASGDSSTDLRLDQAELFAEAGMNAQAGVFALSILDKVRKQHPQDTDFATLERLYRILYLIGDEASAREAEELNEDRSMITVQNILGWIN